MNKYPDVKTIVLLESKLVDFMLETAILIPNKLSFHIYRDDDFMHRRDRKTNDIHLFLETKFGNYLHCRAYTRFMLRNLYKVKKGEIFLTGYHKDEICHIGGKHSLRQSWYKMQPELVSDEITKQNKHLFS